MKKITHKHLLKQYSETCSSKGKPKSEDLQFEMDHKELVEHISDNQNEITELQDSEITLYNPTGLIKNRKSKYLALRVEPKTREDNSHIIFVEQKGEHWKIVKDTPHIHLQDPFHMDNVAGFQIFGGVETFPDRENPEKLNYRTVFYRFKNRLGEMKHPFAKGPEGMKDIRMIGLPNGKIGVFTRPQGGIYGAGKIGYTELNSLDELKDSERLSNAPIIEGIFGKGEWGGVNDLCLLNNNKIGVLGHLAHWEKRKGLRIKNYYAITFIFDPINYQVSNIKIIATADDHSDQVKHDSLGSVLFSGGIELEENRAELYAGVGDLKAVKFELANPFAAI